MRKQIRHHLLLSALLALIPIMGQSEQIVYAKVAAAQEKPQQVQKEQGVESENAFDDLQSKVFVLVMNGKYDEAKPIVKQAIKTEKIESRKIDLIYLLSAVERMESNYKDALANLNTVLKAQKEPKSQADYKDLALIEKRIGECYWGLRQSKNALPHFFAALAACEALPKDDQLTASILESITGIYTFEKNYADAEKYGVRNLQIATERADKSKSLDDVGSMFWARLQLLSIYRNTGQEDKRKKLAQEGEPLLNQLLTMRAEMDKSEDLSDLDKYKQQFEQQYIQQYHPKTPAEYLWLASEFRLRTLPLIQWPSQEQPAKAAILCIHGLGLDNRSFTGFGHEMQKRGYSVYAMDVRGFGSWLSSPGQEDVHFDDTVKDIGTVLHLIKERENNLPVFLLGESMGGAIALRGAAAQGTNIAGVISSVPSAELFQQRRMSMSVAFHLLQGGKNKPFRVGDMVAEGATSNEELAKKWKNDAKAKMEMSPKELIKFAVFMRTTKKECEKIEKTPALLIQGLKDKLVKPAGTVELFEAVSNDDKALLLLGTFDHLIFETFKPSKFLTDAICTWMEGCCTRANQNRGVSTGLQNSGQGSN